MKNAIAPSNAQPAAGIPVVAQPNITQSVVAQPTVVNGCSNPTTVGLGVVAPAIIAAEKLTAFLDTLANMEQLLRRCEQSNWGSRVANPYISPILNNVVKLQNRIEHKS